MQTLTVPFALELASYFLFQSFGMKQSKDIILLFGP